MTPREYQSRAIPIVNALADSFPLAEVFLEGMCCAHCGLKAGKAATIEAIEVLHLKSRKQSVRACTWLAARLLRSASRDSDSK